MGIITPSAAARSDGQISPSLPTGLIALNAHTVFVSALISRLSVPLRLSRGIHLRGLRADCVQPASRNSPSIGVWAL